MRKFGLKLWSGDFIKNKEFVKSAEKAIKDGQFGYVELFALPDTFNDTKTEVLAHLKGVQAIIHAPHARQAFNLSDKEAFDDNRRKLKDSQQFADLLDAEFIILHPGFRENPNGLEENIRQFKAFKEARLIIENMPFECSSTHHDMEGVTVAEIKTFINETKCGFCLDFSHAICGANHYKYNIYKILEEFNKLNPKLYHLCDGNITDTVDEHLHYGEGNYDLARLITEYTHDNSLITMETGHGIPNDVTPWLEDLRYIKALIE